MIFQVAEGWIWTQSGVHPISTGLFISLQHWGGGVHPFHKIGSRHLRALKLGELMAYIMFYKIC